MTDLREELMADMASHVPVRCSVCRWLVGRDPDERRSFEKEMADDSFTNRAFVRAIEKRGGRVSPEAVSNHRRNHL